jgi:hypothetical protein
LLSNISIDKDEDGEEAICNQTEQFEDFALRGAFQVTATNLANGTFTYSQIMDHYQYRIIARFEKQNEGGEKTTVFYKEIERGPFIDRVKDSKLWMCNGLRYINLGDARP